LQQVKACLDEYRALNPDLHELTFEEFEVAIRARCHLEFGKDIPKHLSIVAFQNADKDGDNCLSFEEWLSWSITHAFTSEMFTDAPGAREACRISRELGVPFFEAERVQRMFHQFDLDGNGVIDEAEFKNVLLTLMGSDYPCVSTNRMRQYWAEVDRDRDGEVSLNEFLHWYFRIFSVM